MKVLLYGEVKRGGIEPVKVGLRVCRNDSFR